MQSLKSSNQNLKAEKEVLDTMVSEKVIENGKLKDKVKEVIYLQYICKIGHCRFHTIFPNNINLFEIIS